MHISLDELCKKSKAGFVRALTKTLAFTAIHTDGEAVKNTRFLTSMSEEIYMKTYLELLHYQQFTLVRVR